jgi:cytochrome oxidase Cu insertion factor (SCO1/SenC/PrrC family)
MVRLAPVLFAFLSASAVAAPPASTPAVAMQDTNPRSATHGLEVTPKDFKGQMGLWYFRDASCDDCDAHFVTIRKLWQELVDDGLQANLFMVVSGSQASQVAPPSNQSTTWLLDDAGEASGAWNAQSGDLVVVAADGTVRAHIAVGAIDLTGKTAMDELEYVVEGAAFDDEPATTMVSAVER